MKTVQLGLFQILCPFAITSLDFYCSLAFCTENSQIHLFPSRYLHFVDQTINMWRRNSMHVFILAFQRQMGYFIFYLNSLILYFFFPLLMKILVLNNINTTLCFFLQHTCSGFRIIIQDILTIFSKIE